MPTYTHIQFINHIFETTPAKNLAFGKETYLGITPTKDDIAARVAFVNQVIQKAKAQAQVRQRDRTVLKVFMMPEFSFRGTTGAYTMEEGFNLVESLQELVKGRDWQDWLFIFGTVVCKSYAAKQAKQKWLSKLGNDNNDAKYTEIDSNANVEIYNIAPIQKGGFQNQPAHQFAHSVMKRYKSELDFIKEEKLRMNLSKKLVDEKVSVLDATPVPQDFSKFVPPQNQNLSDEDLLQLKYRYIYGDSVFDQDGITFGLEICYDHAPTPQLKNLMKAAAPVLTTANLDPKEIDIHLVTSCGVRSSANSIASKEGYFTHCDGSEIGASEISQVRRIQGQNTLHKAEYIPLTTQVQPLERVALSIPSVRVVKTNKTKNIALGKLYPNGAGQLQIHDTLPLPPFQQDNLSQQRSLSRYLSTEFPIENEKAPVSINGMKTLFDEAVPVSPVNLIPKAKLPRRRPHR